MLPLIQHKTANANPLFDDTADLIASLEHIAFYLQTDAAASIKSPKAWAMSMLRRGYYAPPAGFRSQEERQREAKLRAAQERLERLRTLERQQFDADFECWLAELPTGQRQAFLAGSLFTDSPRSPGARALLRERFLAEDGRPNPYDIDDAA